jgi:Fe-S-cluster containining protein
MPHPTNHYECDGCGACCAYYTIFASRQDAAREPRIAAETLELGGWLETAKWAYKLHPLPFHESCCFLDAGKRCTIYETRPDVCREFAAGAQPCQDARVAKGLPPLAPVEKGAVGT